MKAKLLARSIQAICAGGLVFGMTTAMAQDASVVLQHVEAVNGEQLTVVAYSDPEGEVGNGTYPPKREANSNTDADDEFETPMEVDNYPETEIGNGTSPPDVNPMAQETSVVLRHVEAVAGERLVVVSYSDPETEVGNGTYPPRREANSGAETGDDADESMEADNFPESEIGNGTFPPDLNP